MGLGLGCGGIVLLFAFIMLGVSYFGSIPTDGPVNTIALILVGGGVVTGGLGVLFLLGAGLWAIFVGDSTRGSRTQAAGRVAAHIGTYGRGNQGIGRT